MDRRPLAAGADRVLAGADALGRPESSYAEELHPRILRWTLIGGTSLGVLILMMSVGQGASLVERFTLILFMTGIGTTTGLAVGINEVRSVAAAREAERMRVSAEHVREERDRLRFLNNLLRHNVLNKINAVQAYTRDVAERQDGEFDEELETALEQSRQIAEVIDSVETDGATVETALPENCWVVADDILQYAVENLVRNAIQHHDRDDPTVRVTADDAPGIPEARRAAVLEAGDRGDSGLGLYLVTTVVEGYGGSVTIGDNEPRGTVVALELPRARDYR